MLRKKKIKKDYLLEKIPEILSKEKKGKVLDVGCGKGHYSYVCQQAGFDVIGCDVRAKNFAYYDMIKFKEFDFSSERLPFNDSEFDYVLFLETIEHLEKPFEAIKEIGRVLRGGQVDFIYT